MHKRLPMLKVCEEDGAPTFQGLEAYNRGMDEPRKTQRDPIPYAQTAIGLGVKKKWCRNPSRLEGERGYPPTFGPCVVRTCWRQLVNPLPWPYRDISKDYLQLCGGASALLGVPHNNDSSLHPERPLD